MSSQGGFFPRHPHSLNPILVASRIIVWLTHHRAFKFLTQSTTLYHPPCRHTYLPLHLFIHFSLRESMESDAASPSKSTTPPSERELRDSYIGTPRKLDEDGSETSSELLDPRPSSLTTLTEANLFTGPVPIRYSVSARGMAERGTHTPCLAPPSDQTQPSSPSKPALSVAHQLSIMPPQSPADRPLLIARQNSLKQIRPPLAPPTQELPPPPPPGSVNTSESRPDSRDSLPPSDISSFVLATSAVHRNSYANRTENSQQQELDPSAVEQFSNQQEKQSVNSTPTSPNFLTDGSISHPFRNVLSHSLPRRPSTTSSPVSTNLPTEGPTSLRKQHSFHHTSLPKPPLPLLRHANSFNPTSQNTERPSTSEQHRGSMSGTRKRLFSGSSFRSTRSRAQSPEVDFLSVFSLPMEPELGQEVPQMKTLTSSPDTASIRSSFWEENTPLTPEYMTQSSGTVSAPTDYVPQQIMSPADMLKVEASVLARGDPEGIDPCNRKQELSLTSRASTSASERALRPTSMAQSAQREGRSQPVRSSTLGETDSTRQNIQLPTTGLPPPPRPRPRKPITHFDDPIHAHISRPIPSDVGTCSAGSGETMRRSILKKPSFLEIEDEVEKSDVVSSSFLDFRESFDTVRSTEDEGPM
jgi:hypothetical protein